MRSPSQVLLLAVLIVSLILPPGLPVAGAAKVDPGAPKAKRLLLVGDSLSIGLGQQMEAAFAGKPSVRFAHLGKVSSGLANPAFFDWEANLDAQVKAHHPDVVLIMLGANDDKPLPTPSGRSAPYKSATWDAEYARRIARLHAIAKSENPAAAVYLIGVPIMGDAAFDAGMGHVNGVLAKTAASLPDCAYINVRDVLADASGAYAPVARTASGAVVKLRADDGVHISSAGSRLLAARLVETVAEPSGLPRGELLAAIENRDLTPLARPGRPAAPAAPAAVAVASAPVSAPASLIAEKPAAPVADVAAAVATKPVAAPAVQVAQATVAPKPAAGAAAPAAAPAKILAPAAQTKPVLPTKAAAPAPSAETPAKAVAAVDPVARAVAPAPVVSVPVVAPGVSYAVADGDTLWSVAKRLGVSADALAAANPGVDPRRMSIGQRLALPAGVDVAQVAKAQSRPSLPAASTKVHTVADGDNFWSVARQHGVTVAALTEANPGVDPTRLRIGQALALPVAGATATAARPAAGKQHAALDGAGYVVADGDNFWSIAKRLGVSADDLTRLNAGLDPLRLRPGQVLVVPDNARAEALAAPAPAGNARTVSDAGLYPVAPGDTLWGLSRRFGVSLEEMLAVNGEVDPSRLRVGQLVTVPVEGGVASAETLLFPVSAGDSLWSIARRFDVSVEALTTANPGVDPLRLREGQTIRVPSSLAAVAASGAPAKEAPAKAPAAAAPAVLPAEAQGTPAPALGPAAGPAHAPARQHVISEGDNLWKLARVYGLSVQRILAENSGLDPMRLRVGTVLALPVGVASMAAR